ncbi:hypothetical protein AMIS_27250 [Actinoplanes missouriensis 431]|uniref:Uncharacterized protein n=1 Tax=Actinoplanes missouriensis (strain ATCC 14538 / DSM 43046 / CBS 188.64 / JCM 3121 / NBRC 102363 / NCIMB 12654 / NRRL B-3342 / UNCC 431) TaxID=512565 RepID=I0H4K8_ACTM4|nr:hypothetical protein AMIS_27250 [Actinoplanes missouriensis 431]
MARVPYAPGSAATTVELLPAGRRIADEDPVRVIRSGSPLLHAARAAADVSARAGRRMSDH